MQDAMQQRNNGRHHLPHHRSGGGPARNPFANRGNNGSTTSKRLGYTDSRYNNNSHGGRNNGHHGNNKGQCLSNPFSILSVILVILYAIYTFANPPMPVGASLSPSASSSSLLNSQQATKSASDTLLNSNSNNNNAINSNSDNNLVQQKNNNNNMLIQTDFKQEASGNHHPSPGATAGAADLKVNQAFYADGEELGDVIVQQQHQQLPPALQDPYDEYQQQQPQPENNSVDENEDEDVQEDEHDYHHDDEDENEPTEGGASFGKQSNQGGGVVGEEDNDDEDEHEHDDQDEHEPDESLKLPEQDENVEPGGEEEENNHSLPENETSAQKYNDAASKSQGGVAPQQPLLLLHDQQQQSGGAVPGEEEEGPDEGLLLPVDEEEETDNDIDSEKQQPEPPDTHEESGTDVVSATATAAAHGGSSKEVNTTEIVKEPKRIDEAAAVAAAAAALLGDQEENTIQSAAAAAAANDKKNQDIVDMTTPIVKESANNDTAPAVSKEGEMPNTTMTAAIATAGGDKDQQSTANGMPPLDAQVAKAIGGGGDSGKDVAKDQSTGDVGGDAADSIKAEDARTAMKNQTQQATAGGGGDEIRVVDAGSANKENVTTKTEDQAASRVDKKDKKPDAKDMPNELDVADANGKDQSQHENAGGEAASKNITGTAPDNKVKQTADVVDTAADAGDVAQDSKPNPKEAPQDGSGTGGVKDASNNTQVEAIVDGASDGSNNKPEMETTGEDHQPSGGGAAANGSAITDKENRLDQKDKLGAGGTDAIKDDQKQPTSGGDPEIGAGAKDQLADANSGGKPAKDVSDQVTSAGSDKDTNTDAKSEQAGAKKKKSTPNPKVESTQQDGADAKPEIQNQLEVAATDKQVDIDGNTKNKNAAVDTGATEDEKLDTKGVSVQHDGGDVRNKGAKKNQKTVGVETGKDGQNSPDENIDSTLVLTGPKAPKTIENAAETDTKEKIDGVVAEDNLDEKKSNMDAKTGEKSKPKGLRGASKSMATDDKEKASKELNKKETKTQGQEKNSKETKKEVSKTNDQVGPKPDDDGKQEEAVKGINEDKTKEQLTQADVVAVGRTMANDETSTTKDGHGSVDETKPNLRKDLGDAVSGINKKVVG